MRITTFSNNKIFGPQAQGKRSSKSDKGGSILSDMAKTVGDNAQAGLKEAATQQAAISQQDKVELSVKTELTGSAVYQALTGTDSKLANEKQMEAQAAKAMQEALERQADSAKDQVEAQKEAMEYMLKMLEIARRISTGGRVPGYDEQKLLEYSQVLYTMAKTMAMQAKEHEEYDSLFEDEEQSAEAGAGAEPVEAASGEMAAPEVAAVETAAPVE